MTTGTTTTKGHGNAGRPPRKTAAAKPDKTDKTVQQVDDNATIQTKVAWQSGYTIDHPAHEPCWGENHPSTSLARDYAVAEAQAAAARLRDLGLFIAVDAVTRQVTTETTTVVSPTEKVGSYR